MKNAVVYTIYYIVYTKHLLEASLCSLIVIHFLSFYYVVPMIKNKYEHMTMECAWYNFMSTFQK